MNLKLRTMVERDLSQARKDLKFWEDQPDDACDDFSPGLVQRQRDRLFRLLKALEAGVV